MCNRLAGVFLLVTTLAPLPRALEAQSLADVARAEEARRKLVKAPARVYTNESLVGSDQSSERASSSQNPATATPTATPASGAEVVAPGKPEPLKPAVTEPQKDEKYWKDRVSAAREALARNKVLADALQSRVNALNHDFAATDDPAQRAVVEQNRKNALREIDRISQDIEKQNKAITDIEEEARKASVPGGWLR